MMPLKEAIRTPVSDLPWYHWLWIYPITKTLDGLTKLLNKVNKLWQ